MALKKKKCPKCPKMISTHPPSLPKHMVAAHGATPKNGSSRRKATRKPPAQLAPATPVSSPRPRVTVPAELGRDVSDGAAVVSAIRAKARKHRETAAELDKAAEAIKELF